MAKITPVLLGADLNCYNFARAFHEAYGVESYAFGRYEISATKKSKIINFTVVPDIDNEETMVKTLTEFARQHEGEELYLFGCTDDYAAMIIRCASKLPQFIAPCPKESLYTLIQKKAEFYEVCEKYGIPYPKTVVLTERTPASELTEKKLGFEYPIVIKPSSSVDYWKFPFDGMKKVYFAKNPDHAERIIDEIYHSGYSEKMILQERIEGGDSSMRVFTAFSDKNGKVRAMCLGHTMIEEHTPKGLGNHAAIVTEPVSELPCAMAIKNMLEDMGYTGFSNFDLKFTGKEGDFRAFEINLRQGRSNYYVTSCGMNIARLAVEKWDDGKDDCVLNENEHFWHHVPASVAFTYTEDKALVEKAKKLKREGKSSCSLKYDFDLNMNPARAFYVYAQLHRQKKKFKVFYPKTTK